MELELSIFNKDIKDLTRQEHRELHKCFQKSFKKIGGLPVDVDLWPQNTGLSVRYVHSSGNMIHLKNFMVDYAIGNISSVLKRLKNSHMTSSGELIDKVDVENWNLQGEMRLDMEDFFRGCKDIELRSFVCSICREYTEHETNCKHMLCIRCIHQIQEENPRCPICRQDIFSEDDV